MTRWYLNNALDCIVGKLKNKLVFAWVSTYNLRENIVAHYDGYILPNVDIYLQIMYINIHKLWRLMFTNVHIL